MIEYAPKRGFTFQEENDFAAAIADKVEPRYRCMGRSYSCTGHIAERWTAAFEGARQAFELRQR